MSRSRLILVALAATSMTWWAGACGSQEPDLPPVHTPAQANEEYRAEAATLQLAPGWSWPSNPLPDKAPDGAGNVYEPGFGKQAADHFWFCSWSARLLDPSLTEAERQAALANVAGIKQTYYYLTALEPDSRPHLDDIVSSVQLGDYSSLKQDFLLNCPTGQDR